MANASKKTAQMIGSHTLVLQFERCGGREPLFVELVGEHCRLSEDKFQFTCCADAGDDLGNSEYAKLLRKLTVQQGTLASKEERLDNALRPFEIDGYNSMLLQKLDFAQKEMGSLGERLANSGALDASGRADNGKQDPLGTDGYNSILLQKLDIAQKEMGTLCERLERSGALDASGRADDGKEDVGNSTDAEEHHQMFLRKLTAQQKTLAYMEERLDNAQRLSYPRADEYNTNLLMKLNVAHKKVGSLGERLDNALQLLPVPPRPCVDNSKEDLEPLSSANSGKADDNHDMFLQKLFAQQEMMVSMEERLDNVLQLHSGPLETIDTAENRSADAANVTDLDAASGRKLVAQQEALASMEERLDNVLQSCSGPPGTRGTAKNGITDAADAKDLDAGNGTDKLAREQQLMSNRLENILEVITARQSTDVADSKDLAAGNGTDDYDRGALPCRYVQRLAAQQETLASMEERLDNVLQDTVKNRRIDVAANAKDLAACNRTDAYDTVFLKSLVDAQEEMSSLSVRFDNVFQLRSGLPVTPSEMHTFSDKLAREEQLISKRLENILEVLTDAVDAKDLDAGNGHDDGDGASSDTERQAEVCRPEPAHGKLLQGTRLLKQCTAVAAEAETRQDGNRKGSRSRSVSASSPKEAVQAIATIFTPLRRASSCSTGPQEGRLSSASSRAPPISRLGHASPSSNGAQESHSILPSSQTPPSSPAVQERHEAHTLHHEPDAEAPCDAEEEIVRLPMRRVFPGLCRSPRGSPFTSPRALTVMKGMALSSPRRTRHPQQ